VYRVVKPGGHLLWADFRNPADAAQVDEDIHAVGFEVKHAALITPNVLDAMANQGERYRALIDRKVPRFARGIFYHYAGVEGTPVLDSMRSGELVYMHRVMVKPG
jgi:hypothetical protein